MGTKFEKIGAANTTKKRNATDATPRRKKPKKKDNRFKIAVSHNNLIDCDQNDNIDAFEDDSYIDRPELNEDTNSLFTGLDGTNGFSIDSDDTQLDGNFFNHSKQNEVDTTELPSKKRKILIKKKIDTSHNGSILDTSVLPDSFRSVFKFQKFNKMQSAAFPSLYQQDNNCVISSPTGSGKTVLFELAILRLINKLNFNIGNFKVLYIAPTKSLCCEMLNNWKDKFLNVSVGMLTSDTSYLETEKVKKSNIIITTPEKWDLLTRKWSDYSLLFNLIKLLLVDEVHTLRENRGATLEVVVTRMNILCENLRIIAVSATIPNIEDVGEWLNPKNNHNNDEKENTAVILAYDDSYRQVLLKRNVYGYSFNGKNDFQCDALFNHKLEDIFQKHSKNRPILIFCPTRSSTITTAKYIGENMSFYDGPNNYNRRSQVTDRNLAECLKSGIAFHHAGLSLGDRTVVENDFRNGNIKILCSTSTLAMGVNLPAYLVIVKGTRIWNSSDVEEYSQLDILQMIGRAGRPEFETEGCAVVMTSPPMKEKYENLIYGNEQLESTLHLNLIEHLIVEMSLGTVYDVNSACEWLKNSFLFVRLLKRPVFYREIYKFMNNDNSLVEQLNKFCESLFEMLMNAEIIVQKENMLVCTAYGHAMSKHYVMFESTKLFINSKKNNSLQEILILLSNAKEFADIRIRHNEKRLFKEINTSPLLKYPFLNKKNQSKIIDQTSQKISLIIQYEIGGLEFPSYEGAQKLHQTLVQDKMRTFRHCYRLLKCMVDVFIERKDGVSLQNTLTLLRSINGNCWDNSFMVLRQLKLIGLVSVRKLVHHGVTSLQDLKNLSDAQLEYYLGLKTGNGHKIKNDLLLLPKLRIRSKLENCKPQGTEIILEFKVEVTAIFKSSTWHGHSLSLDIEVFKKSGDLIDFRRINLKNLLSARSFRISTVIDSKDDIIEFDINCQEVAGIGDMVLFSASEIPKDYYIILQKRKQTALEKCLFLPDSDDALGRSDTFSSDDSFIQYLEHNKLSNEKEDGTKSGQDAPSRTLMPNGNYECYHVCKDKVNNGTTFLCCKEGIPQNYLKHSTEKVTNSKTLSRPREKNLFHIGEDKQYSSPIEEDMKSDSIKDIGAYVYRPNSADLAKNIEGNDGGIPPALESEHQMKEKPLTLIDTTLDFSTMITNVPLDDSSSSSSLCTRDNSALNFLGSDVDLS
ncbi:DNA helicase NDAI_0I03300 [Naumovozyma dairenensis CBS 421]|uniref:RNA helicase n=1 Tax=Naumovozyma dairenensis (strain ATCC 10597 / BCRC 20456 / CBS 421 / NBRC 0211 / NRRL Y-12639) TaxID=1071378 RepID=G0WGI7_NAUDC|nr:hypothetical protein NDAI_0I03300 [Naumovozyma dairenensis CBS 421]CCD26898.1 hypothetical protein NDAI_0I03300 [Naumovozyma dairenensis CBS 421]